jgi:hypothetical protein
MTEREREDEDAFNKRLAKHPRFVAIIERSRASYEATGGVSLAELRKKHRVSSMRRRQAIRGRSKP